MPRLFRICREKHYKVISTFSLLRAAAIIRWDEGWDERNEIRFKNLYTLQDEVVCRVNLQKVDARLNVSEKSLQIKENKL